MKKYFYIIGVMELIAVGIIDIVYLVYFFINFGILISDAKIFLLSLLSLVVLFVLAPTWGLLLISHSKLLPEMEETEKPIKRTWEIRDEEVSFNVGDSVVCVDKKVNDQYGVLGTGQVVFIDNNSIGVRFSTKRGHYTIRLMSWQIRKA